ncbi:transmembrane and coiled-coil domain-containing protein 5B-like isoform X1 [Hylobates moloch]|uniref:transmembrane and coiled-coil domain-containing protein 5B-like isoform X1 n=1 Tax=Hylobates moloch TaxID=81572 RepID=UPI0026766886|nr:transmembrane and coiled-coil domain-containing protein 5B-like isoform X1 [Hylobates moloch]XP_058283895.1 transmembrane and coiled-coil domain-containing protein 5B-like isoform X1 [Hylobates moloch]
MMEDVGQNPLDEVYRMIESPALEAVKQNLNCLNSDLEKDLQKLDVENQVVLRKIKEKEESIQSLERELALSLEQAKEEEELNCITDEQEESLRELELEIAKLEKSNAVLSRNVVEIQKKIAGLFTNIGSEEETTKQILEETKARLQKSRESCAKQEEEMAKIESDYQSVSELCKDQVYYIKKYQQVVRTMKEEKEVLLLEKEISKAQNDSSQIVKPGSILVDTTQRNMDKTTIKKQERICWYKYFQYLTFMALVFIKLLACVFFHLRYINPDFLVDVLPLVLSRGTLESLRKVLRPLLTLEVEELLPH